MVVFPNIKINIGLFITGKRPDGYHNIESIFYPVQWTEGLEIVERDSDASIDEDLGSMVEKGKVRFFSYGIPIPGDPDKNLCIKVFELLEEWFNLPETDIHLLKKLPIGAGLGGGSADAAYALRALKDYYNLTISDKEAMELLAKVGSDCPFFWKNKPMFVFGRGEQMRPSELDLSAYHILLVNPGFNISTAEAYAGIKPSAPTIDLNLLPTLDISTWKEVVKNDFEESLFPTYPALGEIKDRLYDGGAVYASMSGSGSTVYGIFKEEPNLDFGDYMTWKGKLTF